MGESINNNKKKDAYDGILTGVLKERREHKSGTLCRQNLIKEIQKINKSKVINYTANFNNAAASITSDDIVPLAEALNSIGDTDTIDLIIHSPGGDQDFAEKMIKICREYCKTFRVIVPNMAKSAATLVALGTDEIIMGYLSELGPIDPQLIFVNPKGVKERIPVKSITDSWEKMDKDIKDQGQIPLIYIPILNNYDFPRLDYCKKAIERTKSFAVTWLKNYMCKGDVNKAEEIADRLSDVSTHLSHAKVIDSKEAKAMGLNIKLLDKDDELWKMIWELHVRSDIFLRSEKQIKLIETETISISFG